MMRIAFYKGTKEGIAGVYNRGVRWIEDGLYSHCEIIFSSGVSASSSYMDGGVRFKEIEYDLTKWDIFDIPWADETRAKAYFTQRIGRPYNLYGNLHFVFGFIRGDSYGEFCSEACAGALGLKNPWQVAPNVLANIVLLINERFEMNKLYVSGGTGTGGDDTGSGQPPVKPPTNP
jgi:hypothetical protein